MEQGIYADVLLVTNYVVNTAIILCVGKFSGRSSTGRRTVAAALVGAAGSLVIFLPYPGVIISVLIKLGLSAAMVFTAFKAVSLRLFLKQVFMLFSISFAFAGAMLGLWLTFEPPGMSYSNGVAYFNISPLLLLATTAAVYALLSLAARLLGRERLGGEILRVTVGLKGATASARGLVDSGNRLIEPFSGMPVVVCSPEILEKLLPGGKAAAFLAGGDMAEGLPAMRVVPYSHVGGSGALRAFKPDFLRIDTPKGSMMVENVYLGFSGHGIGDGANRGPLRYDCLLSPGLHVADVGASTESAHS
jgi:stage II sporulation protein GA (sporulation sigma-E factor processing peptidase)